MNRFNLLTIITEFYSTFENSRKMRIDYASIVILLVMPLIILGWCLLSEFVFEDLSGLITGISIVSALLCAMAPLIFQIRITIDEYKSITNRDVTIVDNLFISVMYAIVIGFTLTIYLIVIDCLALFERPLSNPTLAVYLTSIAAAVSTHLALSILICIKKFAQSYDVICKPHSKKSEDITKDKNPNASEETSRMVN